MPAWLDPRRWSRRRRALIGALVVLLGLLARPFDRRARAASLLLRFADANARGWLAGYGRHAIVEDLREVPTARGPVRARLYSPIGAPDAPGVVLVHGVHRLSIDEPRLMRLARALASSGVVVLTPEVREIADYRIDPASIETIGASARHLRRQLERPVGLIGTSFAGGLALLAASDPRFASDVGVVLAVGAQHDMRRVLRFFRTGEVLWPDGRRQPLGAHPYGALVLIYGQLDRLMPPDEAPTAADAIRLWLWDCRDDARARLADLGPSAWRLRIEALLEGKGDEAAALLDAIGQDDARAAAVSPAGHLASLRAQVFLLHGEGDSVIPAGETAWLAREVPPHLLRAAVITPALEHVELRGTPTLGQQWELVDVMDGVVQAARGR